MYIYKHTVQYYETDQMGCVHHSNYIRWFEEARTHFMRECNFEYGKMEKDGIIIPVLKAYAEYRKMTHFEDTVLIETKLEKYNGVKIQFSYTVKSEETGEIKCTGTTEHCFLNTLGKPVSLKKYSPQYHEKISLIEKE